MKKREILKQQYELTNNFNNDAMFTSLQSQINDKVFKELINNEKHSLTVEFRVFVNEEEREDKDPKLVRAMEVVKEVHRLHKELPIESLSQIDFFKLFQKAGSIDVRGF